MKKTPKQWRGTEDRRIEPFSTPALGQIEAPETTLDEIFKYLGSAEKPCVVAIDEFQQISEYAEKNTEALLRTKIQHCPNCKFIFAGSEKDMLINMFNSQDKPFYKSATFMEIGCIDLGKYTEFAIRLFKETGKTQIRTEVGQFRPIRIERFALQKDRGERERFLCHLRSTLQDVVGNLSHCRFYFDLSGKAGMAGISG